MLLELNQLILDFFESKLKLNDSFLALSFSKNASSLSQQPNDDADVDIYLMLEKIKERGELKGMTLALPEQDDNEIMFQQVMAPVWLDCKFKLAINVNDSALLKSPFIDDQLQGQSAELLVISTLIKYLYQDLSRKLDFGLQVEPNSGEFGIDKNVIHQVEFTDIERADDKVWMTLDVVASMQTLEQIEVNKVLEIVHQPLQTHGS